ncbi:MAG: galactose/methyl galactoside ABC transporter permease MglC [Spirochaetota bacterium]
MAKGKQFLQSDNFTSVKDFSGKNAMLLVLLTLVVAIGIIQPSFLSLGNIRNILVISSVRVIIALGAGIVLITKGTDLSAGRVVGLTACIAASLLQRPDYANKMYPDMGALPILIPILLAIAVGLIVGVLNGGVVAYFNVPPFIATLGTMVIVYGAASIYIDRPPLGAQPIGGLRDDFTSIGTGYMGFSSEYSIPYLVLIAAAVIFIMWVILNKTELGKNIYAIGGNPDAAVVSGVNIKKNLIIVYAIAGMLYGLGGTLLSARTGGATNNYGSMYELDAIAACVIGGVSTSGGVGKVGGVIIGVLIFEVLNNGLVILGVSAYWQQIIKGLIIVAAVALDIRKYIKKR